MPYRGPNPLRMFRQSVDIFQHDGQTATWKSFLGSSTGNPALGLGGSAIYRTQTITALFAPLPKEGESQSIGGLIAGAEFAVTTREKVQRNDMLVFRGVSYRIESDPMPEKLSNSWVSYVKRATP